MSKVGIHLLTWTPTLDDHAVDLFRKAKDMGFDGVEIFLPDPLNIKFAFVRKLRAELDRLGLECTGSAGLQRNENLVDDDPEIRKRGMAYLKRFIDISADLRVEILAGVLYGTFEMSVGRPRTEEEWNRAVQLLQEAADYAKEKNVVLGLEVINRYETYFLNTAADGTRLAREIGRDNVKVHLDTYHMNIEEKDFYHPIVETGSYLGHMHCCANDRGVPGSGNIDWDQVFKGLAEIKYRGWLTIETFVSHLEGVPVASSVWRPLAKDADEVPRKGCEFIRAKAKEYGL